MDVVADRLQCRYMMLIRIRIGFIGDAKLMTKREVRSF